MATMRKIFAAYEARKSALEATAESNPFASGIAYIEGQYVPLHNARIPLLDEGFLHGDLTYDVPAVWDGRFFRLDDHIKRFEASSIKLRMKLPLPKDEIKRILIEMVARSGIRDAFVELILTRGLTMPRGTKLEDHTSNIYLFIKPYVWVMLPEVQMQGSGSAIIARTVKRTPVGSMDPTVKNLQWGDFTRGKMEAQDREAGYPFLTDGDGNLTEGSGFNICLIKDGVLFTPLRGVLEGVTRKTVLEIAREEGIDTRVEFVPADLTYKSDEIFMCTTAGGIMPITVLDGQKVGNGEIGPLTARIWDKYWAMHWDPKLSFEVKYESEGPKAKL